MNFAPEIFVPGAPYATAYVCSPLKHAVYAVRVPFLALNLDRPVFFSGCATYLFLTDKSSRQRRSVSRADFDTFLLQTALALLVTCQGRKCQMPFGCGPYEDPKESTCLEPSWNFVV
ncbi:hypothetical protein CJ030_MR4G023320 [Morella rubra]|uniref:Uncharacterized protein n=1 Tax=Morella rubra TaxID=262757 RepID=A0A6A1VRX3_9ROSI|nr:hypothetical protein CJ030_MR4G023320 [Morella rubra]